MHAIAKLCVAGLAALSLVACASQRDLDIGANIRSLAAAPVEGLAAPQIFVATTRCDDDPQANPAGPAKYLRDRCWNPVEEYDEVKALGFGMFDGGKLTCAMATVPILPAGAGRGEEAPPASLTREECGPDFEPLRQRIRATPRKSALVFVHGYNTNFVFALRRAAQLARDLNPDGLTILFSPGAAGYELDYAGDIESSELAVPSLNRLLASISAKPGGGVNSVDVIAHSLGARLTLRAITEGPPPKLRNLILPAADVEPAYFVRQAGLAAPHYERLIAYTATKDRALGFSQTAHFGWKRAGVGLPLGLGQDLAHAEFIDATKVAKDQTGNYHSYFAESLPVLNDIRTILLDYKKPADREPRKCQRPNPNGAQFCAFP